MADGYRVGVIATMKAGMEHFVYRELVFLTLNGFSISLFPTKYRPGLYYPRDEWRFHRWNAASVILRQPLHFLRTPKRYLQLFWEALQINGLVDLLLAWHFAEHMDDVDVIYSTFGDHKLFIGHFCKRIMNKPLVVTIHAYELYSNPNRRLFVHALANCDEIIAATEHNKEYLIEHYGVDPSNVNVIRYSVDIADYKPEKKFVVLIVGYFVNRKGHDILFKAIKELSNPDIEVWVVGGEDGRRVIDVYQMAADIGVEDQVAFFGKLRGNALKAVYRSCDVFCLPCRKDDEGNSEGFPNVLIEAMAFAKPVVTSRHVEIPRIIPEIIVEENDVQGIADAIDRLYHSAELRRRLGEQNRQIAVETFAPDNTAKTAALFRKMIVRGDQEVMPVSTK